MYFHTQVLSSLPNYECFEGRDTFHTVVYPLSSASQAWPCSQYILAGPLVGVCYPLPEGEEMHDQVSTGSVVVVVAALLDVVNKSSGSIKK